MTDAVATRLNTEVLSTLGTGVGSKAFQLNVEVLSSLRTVTYAQASFLSVEVLSVNSRQRPLRQLWVTT